jgi:hypothetical protein
MKDMQPVDQPVHCFRWRGICIVLAAVVLPVVLLLPPLARGASYSVWACADASGHLLTRGDWKEVRVSGDGHFLSSTCGDVDASPVPRLLAIAQSARGHPARDSGAGWKVQSAPGTNITGLDVWWSGTVPAGPPMFSGYLGRVEVLAPASIFRMDGNGETGGFFGPGATGGRAFDEGNHWSFRKLNTADVTLMAWCIAKCDGVPGPGGDVLTQTISVFEVYRLKTIVDDGTPPAGTVTGLEDGARISTPTVVHAIASDIGGGVREILLRVDGRVVQHAMSNDSCADVDRSNGNHLDYISMQPCPSHDSQELTLSPSLLADGARHVVSVVAIDAAGQQSVLGAARIALAAPNGFFSSAGFFNPDLNVVAPRTLNGTNGAPANVRLSFVVRTGSRNGSARRLTVGPNVRPWIDGRLSSDAGAPISGARVWRATAVTDGVWQISGAPLTTSATGRVRGRLLAHSPSRNLRLVYFPYSDSSENVQSVSRRLDVRASTTIRLDKARYRNGDTVSFSGRITAKPIVPRKSVYLQVVVRGRWRTFDTTRADSEGRWSLRYRFTATRRLTAYRFRAVIPAEQTFPWATGRSRAVRVFVTP